MAPSDMQIRVGRMEGYNNEIVITTASQTLGFNGGINEVIGLADSPTDTGEIGLVKPEILWEPSDFAGGNFALATSVTSLAYSLPAISQLDEHQDKKPRSWWMELQ